MKKKQSKCFRSWLPSCYSTVQAWLVEWRWLSFWKALAGHLPDKGPSLLWLLSLDEQPARKGRVLLLQNSLPLRNDGDHRAHWKLESSRRFCAPLHADLCALCSPMFANILCSPMFLAHMAWAKNISSLCPYVFLVFLSWIHFPKKIQTFIWHHDQTRPTWFCTVLIHDEEEDELFMDVYSMYCQETKRHLLTRLSCNSLHRVAMPTHDQTTVNGL